MILIYKTIPAKTLRKKAKEAIALITAWFKKNPDRTNCNAELFYGRRLDIKPGTVKQQIDKFVKELIAEDESKNTRRKGNKAKE